MAKTIKLNNRVAMPLVGYGVFQVIRRSVSVLDYKGLGK